VKDLKVLIIIGAAVVPALELRARGHLTDIQTFWFMVIPVGVLVLIRILGLGKGPVRSLNNGHRFWNISRRDAIERATADFRETESHHAGTAAPWRGAC
jgi:hypothetical protein